MHMTTKEKLLLYLKENKGNWVSGELLSGKLGVSRAAICKHVRKLKEDGYEIDSSTRKGYLFSKISDVLSADEIREGLNTKVFGNNIVCLKETDSTNRQRAGEEKKESGFHRPEPAFMFPLS
ncbi:MAG: biotin operon repressor [Deltaproteobacteria bacterium]|nr:biotin operon repressor [Deltaproteobacteria bacterium]